MKRFLVLGLLALGVGLATEQPAHAWINSKFSVGLNWNYQSGGNNLLWGLFRNAQPPCPEPGPGGPFQFQPPPGPGMYPPSGAQHRPSDFQYYGQQAAPNQQGPAATSPVAAPTPAAAPAQQQAYGTDNPWYSQQNLYQPVSFNPASYGYPATGYGASATYPGYYGYTVPPSYWYGR